MTEQYQGWKYICEERCGHFSFNVEPDHKIVIPETLFKFYALSENSIDALTGLYLYASHPNQLNDPTDCSELLFDFSNTQGEDLKGICGELYPQIVNEYGGIDGLKNDASSILKLILYKYLGIISLCNNCNSPVMWAHYTQNIGFCVEFDWSKFPFNHYGPFPIHYVDSFSQIKINNNIHNAILIQSNVKTKDWEYEHEYRILAICPNGMSFEYFNMYGEKDKQFNFGDEHNRRLKYPLDAIKSIILPKKFFQNHYSRTHVINLDDIEVVILESSLQRRLMDFLSNPKMKFDVKISEIHPDGSQALIKVDIINTRENTYRIISKN